MREFLIKTFDKEEYAQSFIQNGEMLFRHIRYFNQIEDNQVRGDSEEGLAKESATLHLNQNVKTIHLGNSRFAVDWGRFKKEHPEIKFKDENVEFRLEQRKTKYSELSKSASLCIRNFQICLEVDNATF